MGSSSGPHESGAAERATVNRVTAERLLRQAGGVSGVIYSSLPVVIFVIASSLSGLLAAIASALTAAALVLVWRLIRRDSIQPALSGFFGVAICALVAYVVGESKGYFLLGIWMSLVWAVVVAVSIVIRRPLVGYVWTWATGRGQGWRDVPRAVHAFDLASICWVLVFAARFVVQGLLYNADQTGWLAVARIAMGWPLTVAAALVTYLAIKSAQRSMLAVGDSRAPIDADPVSD
ncbi:DUF3159 domain-containing protein [Mycobacterium scrofulaceum]|uniref:DUF3159 domain-containing protein n=1 Tax=Mycobacterium scrofulaceum TaxID=1783 RepID=A0A1A2UEX0_MYCSC|nr:DUF3159 domain-containing protein [Mycobacterium scrofulaceum]OBH87076.1 hypothetical protein A5681_14525 [Mycobacterium scrofulaceum]OBI03498.1 hypothetical protein A5679_16260 [Mycobacterium scrofulaceum]